MIDFVIVVVLTIAAIFFSLFIAAARIIEREYHVELQELDFYQRLFLRADAKRRYKRNGE